MHQYCTHLFWIFSTIFVKVLELLSFISATGTQVTQENSQENEKVVKCNKKNQTQKQQLYKQWNLIFLCGPYIWSNVYALMKLTIQIKLSDNMESGTRSCNDVTVWFFLCQLYSLLLFQYQETVEFCRCLFAVCIPTQLEQTDGFGSSLGKSSLKT